MSTSTIELLASFVVHFSAAVIGITDIDVIRELSIRSFDSFTDDKTTLVQLIDELYCTLYETPEQVSESET